MPFNLAMPLGSESLAKLQHLTSIYSSLETAISLLVECRERNLALTNLEQSHMWLQKAIEREQLALNFKQGQSIPKDPMVAPIPPTVPKMSPEATVLAESRHQLDNLLTSIKDLTENVATNGFPIHTTN